MANCITYQRKYCDAGVDKFDLVFTNGTSTQSALGMVISVTSCAPYCGTVTVPIGSVLAAPDTYVISGNSTLAGCRTDGTYDCVGGECLPTTGGTYADLAACVAAGCGTTCTGYVYTDAGCCPGVCWPGTLHLTLSGACAALNGTYTLTWNGSLWESANFTYNGHSCRWQAGCSGANNMGLVLIDVTAGTRVMEAESPNPDCTTPAFSSSDAGAITGAITGGPCDGLTPDWVVSA